MTSAGQRTVDQVAETVLVAHQRLDITGCLCGWSELGRSHARHQVRMLDEAGVLRETHTEGMIA